MPHLRFVPLDSDPEILIATHTYDHRSAAAVIRHRVDGWLDWTVAGDVTHLGQITPDRPVAIAAAAHALCGRLGDPAPVSWEAPDLDELPHWPGDGPDEWRDPDEGPAPFSDAEARLALIHALTATPATPKARRRWGSRR